MDRAGIPPRELGTYYVCVSRSRAVPRRARAASWVAKRLRKIVAEHACPQCGAEPGEPCVNRLFGVHAPPGGFKRPQRRLYQSYVHRQRGREK